MFQGNIFKSPTPYYIHVNTYKHVYNKNLTIKEYLEKITLQMKDIIVPSYLPYPLLVSLLTLSPITNINPYLLPLP